MTEIRAVTDRDLGISLYPDQLEKTYRSFYDYDPLIERLGEVLLKVDDSDYQGDSRVILHRGNKWDGFQYGILIFGWGSCCGCDSLQACNTFEDVGSLARDIERDVKWFDSTDKLYAYIIGKDWELEWSYNRDETKEFLEKAKELLGGDIQDRKDV